MLKPILVLCAAIAFAVSPFLNPEFGGFDPNRYPVPQIDPPVQPAGYAFAIWGPIYLWLLASAVFGVWKRRDDPAWDAMRLPLAVSLAIGAGWLPVALVSPVAATAMIYAMLTGALWALNRSPSDDRWWAAMPAGLYAGWLTAASFVAAGLLLAGWGWMSETSAAWLCLSGALVVAVVVMLRRPVASYGAAAVWALVAVAVQNIGRDTGLVLGALAGAVLIAGFTVNAVRTDRRATGNTS